MGLGMIKYKVYTQFPKAELEIGGSKGGPWGLVASTMYYVQVGIYSANWYCRGYGVRIREEEI